MQIAIDTLARPAELPFWSVILFRPGGRRPESAARKPEPADIVAHSAGRLRTLISYPMRGPAGRLHSCQRLPCLLT